MAIVRTPAERMRDRLAITAVIAITIIMLAPIYWIASTAFKPRSLATTVPPTVFFKPEITPFIKLFTKRVQLLRPVDERALYREAVRQGVTFTPGGTVTVERPQLTSLRLSFSLVDPEDLDEGVRRLARALREVRRRERYSATVPVS